MSADPRFTDAASRLQSLQPHLHLRKAAIFIIAFLFLAGMGFFSHGPERLYCIGLAILGSLAFAVQWHRERALVRNRLSAVGMVTGYCIPGRSRYRIVRFIVRRFAPEVPVIKYSFVAFDQKTYSGETGFGARDLRTGDEILVVYNPENPARNHPLGGFIFYSFG